MYLGGCAIITEDPLVAYLVYREVIKQEDFTKQPDVLVYSPEFLPSLAIRPEDLYRNGNFLSAFMPLRLRHKQHLSLEEAREVYISEEKPRPGHESEMSITAFDAFRVAEGSRVASQFTMNAIFPDIAPGFLRANSTTLYFAAPTIVPVEESSLQPITTEMLDAIRDEILTDIRTGGIPQSEKSDTYREVEQLAAKWAHLVLQTTKNHGLGWREKTRETFSVLPGRSFYSVDPNASDIQKRLTRFEHGRDIYIPFYLHQLFSSPDRHKTGIIGIHGGIGPEAGLHTFQLCRQASPDASLLLASMGRTPIETDYLLSLNTLEGQDPDAQRRTAGPKRPNHDMPMSFAPQGIAYADRDDYHPLRASRSNAFGAAAERVLPADPRAFLSDVRIEMGKVLGDQDICLMACNTAHVFHAELLPYSKGEWLHLPMEGLQSIPESPKGQKRKILVLATPASLRTGLYQQTLEATGRDDLELIPVSDETMNAYYDIIFNDVSYQNYEEGASKTLSVIEQYQSSMQEGDVILLGCTEFSVPQVAEKIAERFGDSFIIVDNDVATVEKAAALLQERQQEPELVESKGKRLAQLRPPERERFMRL